MLSKRMSLSAFENGYWYQTDLVAFGKKLGAGSPEPSARNRSRKALVTSTRAFQPA